MEYYLIFVVLVLLLSLINLKLPTALCFVIFIYALLNGFSFDQLSFIFLDRLTLLAGKQEIMSIPFFLFSSELFYNFGYFDKLKKILFNRLPGKFLPFITYFTLTSTCISSVVIFSSMLSESISQAETKGKLNLYLRLQYFLTAISLLMPVSIPIFIIASLTAISIKKIILLSLLFGFFIFTGYYFLFIRYHFTPENKEEEVHSSLRILPLILYVFLFYVLIFVFSHSILITSEILFLFVIVTTYLQNMEQFKDVFYKAFNNAITRSGIVLSVIYFIYIINFFHDYTNATEYVFDFIITNFSDSGYIIVLIYIVAFFLNMLLDPIGIILVLSPIYISVLETYGIHRYGFVLSFIFFISLGLSSNIEGLPGNSYREKFGLSSSMINEFLLKEHLIVVVISFMPYLFSLFF